MSTNHTDQRATKKRRAMLRVFHLVRDEDISGVSGIGHVAVGVVFPSGRVVLEWLGVDRSFEILDDLDHVERIHGHGGKTRIVFAGIQNVSRLEGRSARALITQFHNRLVSIKAALCRIAQGLLGAARKGPRSRC
jgi:hypothetical protein